jgi:hypothetical protein
MMAAILLGNSPLVLRAEEFAQGKGKPIDGDAVLTARRLKRSGNLYLVENELQIIDKIREGEEALKVIDVRAQTLRQTIAQAQDTMMASDVGMRSVQQQRTDLNSRKQQITSQYYFNSQNVDPDYRAQYQAQYRTDVERIDNQIMGVQGEINRLNTAATLARQQLTQQTTELRQLEADYQSKRTTWEQGFAHLKAVYDPLMKDPEVREALKELNRTARPWVMIGPAYQYEENVRSFAGLVLKEAGLTVTTKTVPRTVGRRTTKVKVAQASLAAQEKSVRDLGNQARKMEPRLKGPQAAETRKAMATVLVQMRKAVDATQEAYAALNGDPLITSAITQLSPGGTVEPSDDFKFFAKYLADAEKKLGLPE